MRIKHIFRIVPGIGILLSALFLISCGSPAERLNSNKNSEAMQAAQEIIEAKTPLRFSAKEVPFLMQALLSGKQTIAYAAETGLVNSVEYSMTPLIGLITNGVYQKNRQISNLMVALKLSDFIRDPILQLRARIQITSLFIKLDPDYSWKIMSELNKHVSSLQGEDALAMKSILMMELGSSYYSLKKKEGLELINQAFELTEYLSKDRYRLDFIQAVSKIIGMLLADEEESKHLKDIEAVISQMDKRIYIDEANFYLAKGMIGSDPEKAYQYALRIRENIDMLLELSGIFGNVDSKKGQSILDLAVKNARSFKDPYEKSKKLLSIAKYQIGGDITSGIEYLNELYNNDETYSELLSAVAVSLVQNKPQRSVFFVNQISEENYKLDVIQNVTTLMLQLPTGFQNHLEIAFGMTNFITNKNAVLRKIALALAPIDPVNAYSYAKTGDMQDEVEESGFLCEFAAHLSGKDIPGAKSIFSELIVPDTNVSHFLFVTKISKILEQLSKIVSFDTMPYFQKITNLIDQLDWQSRQTAMKAATVYLSKSHPELAREFLLLNNVDSNLVELIDELVNRDPLTLEKDALVAMGTNSIAPLIGLLTVPSKIHPQTDELLSILKRISYIENIDRKQFIPLLLLLRTKGFPVNSMHTIVEIFSGITDKNVIELFIQFMRNPDLAELHPAILNSLTQVQDKSVFADFIDDLLGTLIRDDVPLAVRINCVKILGLSGDSRAGEQMAELFFGDGSKSGKKMTQSKDLTGAVIEALGDLGTQAAAANISQYLGDKALYYSACLALGKLKQYDMLVKNIGKIPFTFAVTEAVSRFMPDKKKYKKLGYFGYTYTPLLNVLAMQGFDCYSMKNAEDAKNKNCDIYLSGEYTRQQQGEPEKITGPDGEDLVYSESHFLNLKIILPGGGIIWNVTGYGYGASWSPSVEDISKDPQAALTSEAEENLLKELRNSFIKKKSSLPYNY
ncbi:MAG: hypothetical protein A2014_10440 [Spirochaetes bacterium GWF1_49_6]|nr:MAG: hypothetical protein A2014_10440 [Spirochaetes bacterium GWF1_49_6]